MTFNKPPLAGCLILPIVIGVEAFLAQGVPAQNPPTPRHRKKRPSRRENQSPSIRSS